MDIGSTGKSADSAQQPALSHFAFVYLKVIISEIGRCRRERESDRKRESGKEIERGSTRKIEVGRGCICEKERERGKERKCVCEKERERGRRRENEMEKERITTVREIN